MWMIPDRPVSEKGWLLVYNAIFDTKSCLKSTKIGVKLSQNLFWTSCILGQFYPLSPRLLSVSLLM